MLWQNVNLVFIIFAVRPKLNLRQHLVGEACRHDKAWMTGGTTQVHQTALGKDYDLLSVRKFHKIGSRLNFVPFVVGQSGDLNFAVEMTNVTHDAHWLHIHHMLGGYDVCVASGGAENIRALHCLFHCHHFKAFHRGLQCADRINFSDHDACAAITQRLG